MPFTLGMDEDSYVFTDELSDWSNLLSPLLGWYSLSIGVRVNILQDSSGIGIADEIVGFLLVS